MNEAVRILNDPATTPVIRRHVADNLFGGSVTNHPQDRMRLSMILAGARAQGIRGDILPHLKAKRRAWLNWQTTTQRKWQAHARTVHEDRNLRVKTARQNFGVYAERGTAGEVARRCLTEGIATRENYVRCHDGDRATN